MGKIKCPISCLQKGKIMPAINIIKHLIKQSGIGLGSGEQCYDVMYTVARAFQIQSLVEIGTYKAYSTIVFCQAILDNHFKPIIYAADQWNNYGLDIGVVEPVARKHITQMNFDQYVKVIKGDSAKTIPELFKSIGKVDMCFIDGDHTLKGVQTDFNNCKDHTDIILFHDALCGNDVKDFLQTIKGWTIITFPTKYIEGDNRDLGIALAVKNL